MPSAAPTPPKSSSAAPPPMATLANRDNIKKRESEEEKRRKRRQHGETIPVNEPQESRWPQPKHWQGPDMPQSQRFSPSTLTLVDLANEIRRQEEEEKRRRLFGGPVEVDIPGVSAAPIGWEDDPGIVNLDEPDARERRSWRTADNPPGGVSLKMTPEITLGDRLRGAAMALPNYFSRDVAAPVIDAAESFIANRPNPLETIATAGQPVVDYFLGPDASKQMGMETVAKGLRGTRDMVPRVGQILAEQAQKNIDESLALRGISDQTLPRNLNAAKTATAPPPPTSGTGGGLDIDLGGAFGTEEAEVEEPDVIDITMRPDLGRMAEMGAPQSQPSPTPQGDRPNLGQMAEMGRPVTVEDITPATPIEALGELARNANPTQDAGAVMQSAADVIQGGGLQMGSVDAYLAQRGQDPPTPVPANQAPIRLSPETATPQQVKAAVTSAYDARTAESVMANPDSPHSRAMIQKSLEIVNNDPMRQDRYRQAQATATSVEDVTARLREQGFNRELTEPERRRMEKFLGGIRDEGYPNYAVFSNQAENDMLARATGTPEGPHPGTRTIDSAETRAKRAREEQMRIPDEENIHRMGPDQILANDRALSVALELVRRANLYGGQPPRQAVEAVQQLVDMGEEGINRIGELRAKSTGQTVYRDQIKREFGPGKVIGRGGKIELDDEFSKPLYEGQEPAGRMRVHGYEPLDIYLPDDVSRDLDAIREQGILNRAQVQELIRTQAPGASPDQVIVGTREQFAEQAERIAKNAQQSFSNTLRIAGLDEEGGIEALVARASEGPKTADQRTWWQWLTGKDEPPPTAPAAGNIPEEPVPQRLRALNDINGLYARYGSLVGPQQMNQFIKDNYGRGVPDYFSEAFGPWAEKNRELADQIRSTMGHAAASGLFVPDKAIVFSN